MEFIFANAISKKNCEFISKEVLLRILLIQFLEYWVVLTEFWSCFRFKDTVKVDWSFMCHLGASILSNFILKSFKKIFKDFAEFFFANGNIAAFVGFSFAKRHTQLYFVEFIFANWKNKIKLIFVKINCLKVNIVTQSSISNVTGRYGSRDAVTSKMEDFVIIVNGWKPLTIITKRSILDVAAALDPPITGFLKCWYRTALFQF